MSSTNEEKKLQVITKEIEEDKIICIHCKRSNKNKLPCLGMCVADTGY